MTKKKTLNINIPSSGLDRLSLNMDGDNVSLSGYSISPEKRLFSLDIYGVSKFEFRDEENINIDDSEHYHRVTEQIAENSKRTIVEFFLKNFGYYKFHCQHYDIFQ